MNSETIYNYVNFDPARLDFSPLKDVVSQQKNLKMKESWCNYKDEHNDTIHLNLLTPEILINAYGLTGKNLIDLADIKTWTRINIPLDQANPDVKIFTDKLKQIDNFLDSEEFRKARFGSNYKNYKYFGLIKYPPIKDPSEGDAEPDASVYPKHPFISLNLKHNNSEITTSIGVKTLDPIATDKFVITPITKTLTSDTIREYLGYMTNVTCVIRPGKLWARCLKTDPSYGFKFNMTQAVVRLPKLRNSNVTQSQFSAFLDKNTIMNHDISSSSDTVSKNKKLENNSNNKELDTEEAYDEEDEDGEDEDECDDAAEAAAAEIEAEAEASSEDDKIIEDPENIIKVEPKSTDTIKKIKNTSKKTNL